MAMKLGKTAFNMKNILKVSRAAYRLIFVLRLIARLKNFSRLINRLNHFTNYNFTFKGPEFKIGHSKF